TRCIAVPGTPDRQRARPASARNAGVIPNPYSVFDSSMTGRAARELLDVVFRDQAATELELVRRRHVVDAKNRFPRTDVALGIPMAVEAPLHLQRLLLPHERHPIDLAVAGGAADAFVHVDAVVEVDEIGEIMHPRPLDAAIGAEARAHRLEIRAVRKN